MIEAWWEATKQQRLVLQRCDACGNIQHYPRALCLSCRSTQLGWMESGGAGVVHSFTVVHRAPSPSFTPPYVVALVRLDEGPTLMSNLVDADLDSIRCEQRVTLRWKPLDDGRHLPLFAPVDS